MWTDDEQISSDERRVDHGYNLERLRGWRRQRRLSFSGMITHLSVRNFKRFASLDVDLAPITILAGLNGSGKTTVLQAITLWDHATRYCENRNATPIDHRNLTAIPAHRTNDLWHESRTRDGRTRVRMSVAATATSDPDDLLTPDQWERGFEFTCKDERIISARISSSGSSSGDVSGGGTWLGLDQPPAFITSATSAMAAEHRLERGAVNVRFGDGRAGEVIRSFASELWLSDGGEDRWAVMAKRAQQITGVRFSAPSFDHNRGEVGIDGETASELSLGLSSAGAGSLHVLLFLAAAEINRGGVVLLDCIDAFLDAPSRERVYRLMAELSIKQGTQFIVTTRNGLTPYAALLPEAEWRTVPMDVV